MTDPELDILGVSRPVLIDLETGESEIEPVEAGDCRFVGEDLLVCRPPRGEPFLWNPADDRAVRRLEPRRNGHAAGIGAIAGTDWSDPLLGAEPGRPEFEIMFHDTLQRFRAIFDPDEPTRPRLVPLPRRRYSGRWGLFETGARWAGDGGWTICQTPTGDGASPPLFLCETADGALYRMNPVLGDWRIVLAIASDKIAIRHDPPGAPDWWELAPLSRFRTPDRLVREGEPLLPQNPFDPPAGGTWP